VTKSSGAVVLLSGGLDSSINLVMAKQEFDQVWTLTIDYGQRAAPAEVKTSKELAMHYKVNFEVLEFSFLAKWSGSSLTDRSKKVPTGAEISMDNLETSKKSAASVWVPNRNGLFLNAAGALAESKGAKYVIPGFNKEEAATFPDNSQDYLEAATEAFKFSTRNQVEVKCFTTDLDKSEIVQMGIDLKFDFSKIWPCYFSGDSWCRNCESCQRSLRALKNKGISL
jgi:7-cyano-7-deazaguanine synthase